jgi:GST-like protein
MNDLSAFPITQKWPARHPDRIQLYSLPTPNAVKDFEDKRPRDRYVGEAKRLLGVLDARLADRAWIMGSEYTIADIATFPWVRNLIGFYGAGDLVGMENFRNVKRALDAFVARPAVVRGLEIPRRAD